MIYQKLTLSLRKCALYLWQVALRLSSRIKPLKCRQNIKRTWGKKKKKRITPGTLKFYVLNYVILFNVSVWQHKTFFLMFNLVIKSDELRQM